MKEFLKNELKYNLEKKILPSENVIINRLIEQDLEMTDVYEDLSRRIPSGQGQEQIIRAIISAAAFWNPDEAKKLREDKKRLIDLNKQIAETAGKLAGLIHNRKEIAEKSGFSAYDDYHFMEWVEKAAETNYRYQSCLADKITSLRGQFDLKYWPTSVEVIEAIKSFAQETKVEATDTWTEASTSSNKSSTADFVRTICKAMEEQTKHSCFGIPNDFKLSDEGLATVVNCALNLLDDDIIDSSYVKNVRQRMRAQSSVEQ